ncbi:diguanylate cyclase [Shewanella polaris]|uniref:diguanylate cyclase n=1 Tax=Shewanella polaris TaxID=2588449 RepID=A0A4Y5YBM0_9GAMM|nr:diguanylate cyclase [Shewanella polaris]QDE29968.1 diguanylate cyclase [Shewanella polaris]
MRELSWLGSSKVLLITLWILINGIDTKHAHASVVDSQSIVNLKNSNVVRYCVDPDWLPYEAIVDGRHTGISSDYLALLAHYTNLTFVLVPTSSWRQSLELLKQGECELTPILNQTPKRDQYLSFSQVFFKSPNVLVSLKSQPFLQGFENIGNRLLAIPKDYRLVEYVQRYYPSLNTILTSNERQGLEKVANGEVDVFVGSMFSVNAYIQQQGLTSLKIAGWGGPEDELRIGVIKAKKTLLPQINAGLAKITQADHNAIYKKWHNITVIEDIDYSVVIQVGTVLGMLILFLLYRTICVSKYNVHLEKNNKQLQQLHLELEQKNSDLDFLAQHDPLTKLFNRQYFNQTFLDDPRQPQQNKQANNNISLVVIDIDFFKAINDKHGHTVGDKILVQVAQVLQASVRDLDVVARWGGEEFVVVCQHVALHDATELCQRITDELTHFHFYNNIKVTCSYGIALLKDNEPIQACFERADGALFKAKQSGRNQYCSA